MILGFHCIWTTYGTWLPNEPRGSWSTYVASRKLYRFGPATTVDTCQMPAEVRFDNARKRSIQAALAYEPVVFTGEQARNVAMAIGQAAYAFHALAIMPDHVHVVIGRTERPIRRVIGHLKSNASRALRKAGYFQDRAIWTELGWAVYLDDVDDVAHAVEYVEQNPVRAGLKPQRWSFVQPYRI